MSRETGVNFLQNYAIVTLLILAIIYAAHFEGYLPLFSLIFWVFIFAGFVLSFWLASWVSTLRLLSLFLVITVMEYIKESMGLRYGLWVYHGINRYYMLGVWCWVLAGLGVFALATRLVIPPVRQLGFRAPWWLNPAILILLFILIAITMRQYRQGVGALMWIFYAVLLGIDLYGSSRMESPIFVGLLLSAWIMGNISEALGSVFSRMWTFPFDPYYPPFYLLAGCWPLEVFGQYILSAFLAGEPLDAHTI
jgi:hypothetical protein